MSHRFEIQDIVAQDEVGVLFHALDVETGKAVGLRRFFPFGVAGGGLVDEERTEYARAVEQLAGVSHPGLRSVLTGGCDPVDGVPFVVIEWIEGVPLADALAREPFTPEAAVAVLDRALELSQALSAKLGEEAVWVETTPTMIVLDHGPEHRGFTFGICPIRWLGGHRDRRGLLPLAELAEDLMGWRRRIVGEQLGNGLGGWVKWLRSAPGSITLADARRNLATLTGGRAPALTAPLEPVRPTVQIRPAGTVTQMGLPGQVAMVPESPLKRQLVWIVLLLVLVGGVGWWGLAHPRGARAAVAAAAVPQTAEEKRLAAINARAAELAAGIETAPDAGSAGSAPGTVFQVADSKRILNEKGKEVIVEGVVLQVRAAEKTLFVEFAGSGPQVRGYLMLKDATGDLSEDLLKGLVGKRVRISGVVRVVPAGKAKRPEVLIRDRKSIEELP